MKKTIILILWLSISLTSQAQVSPINLRYEKIISDASDQGGESFSWSDFRVQSSFRYLPQKVAGYQVIKTNRPGAVFDDVYFIDPKGNTEIHSLIQTQPVNYMPGIKRNSLNPNGADSMGQAVILGLANVVSNWLF